MYFDSGLFVFIVLALGSALSIAAKKLTVAGGITGCIVGMIIYLSAGYTGLAMLAAFFIAGTAATSWKKQEKQKLKPANDQPQRKAGQVLANSGIAAIMGLMILYLPQDSALFLLMMAAAFAAATSDTLSSELGMIYGKNFYNILSWHRESRGLDGLISVEGTLFGVLGSLLMAIIYAMGFGFTIDILWIVIAGVSGNLFDSILGASFERKKYIGNDMVNFLNTLFAAAVGFSLTGI